MELKNITAEVCRVAREVGGYLREERRGFKQGNVIAKGAHDYVSYVDRTAEQMTVEALAELLPEAGFVTEEGTVEQSAQGSKGLKWVVDPLDGTTNFIHDTAPYCVSIALQRDSELLVGVVYEVCRGECFYAWAGGGAWLDGERIGVSTSRMEEAFVGLEFPYRAEEYKPVILNAVDKMYGRVAGIRFNGSAAVSMCNVAAGRYDAWGEAFIKPWDYAAGALIVREAGGRVTDFTGSENIEGTHHIVASNGIIHEEFRLELFTQEVERIPDPLFK